MSWRPMEEFIVCDSSIIQYVQDREILCIPELTVSQLVKVSSEGDGLMRIDDFTQGDIQDGRFWATKYLQSVVRKYDPDPAQFEWLDKHANDAVALGYLAGYIEKAYDETGLDRNVEIQRGTGSPFALIYERNEGFYKLTQSKEAFIKCSLKIHREFELIKLQLTIYALLNFQDYQIFTNRYLDDKGVDRSFFNDFHYAFVSESGVINVEIRRYEYEF